MAVNLNEIVQDSVDNSAQSRYRNSNLLGIGMLFSIGNSSGVVAKWWSRKRDIELRELVTNSDHLSGAIYNMLSKMTTIPVKIIARDKSIKSHVALAEQYNDVLLSGSQFGEGWMSFFSRFVHDLITQDNGAFAEVIGPGSKDGPLTGSPITVAHLDSSLCTRTGNAQYPVIYTDTDGRMYKFHNSRIIFASQMPSTDARMNGVGLCAVSRALYSAQNLLDIAIYKMEKLGSRPQRQILLTGGGLDPDDVMNATSMTDANTTAEGMKRYSKTAVVGNRVIMNPSLTKLELSSTPDGFDEKESTILGMTVISMALGMDARELFPGMESGASKADAIISHIKQRGKGPGQIIQLTENLFNVKFLPSILKMVFDYQDDTEDRQAADIWGVRAQARERDKNGSIIDTRIAREKMMESGEITEEQFEWLELSDGRLPDGVSVNVLFFVDDKDYVEFLSGTTESNYEEKENKIMEFLINSRDVEKIKKARRAIAAIDFKYVKPAEEEKKFEQEQMAKLKPPDTSYQQEKLGRKLPGDGTQAKDETVPFNKT